MREDGLIASVGFRCKYGIRVRTLSFSEVAISFGRIF